jgi:hypothetical protein
MVLHALDLDFDGPRRKFQPKTGRETSARSSVSAALPNGPARAHTVVIVAAAAVLLASRCTHSHMIAAAAAVLLFQQLNFSGAAAAVLLPVQCAHGPT